MLLCTRLVAQQVQPHGSPLLPTALHHHPPVHRDSPLGSQNNTSGTHHTCHCVLQAWESKTLPFYSFEGRGWLFGIISHFSIDLILKPLVQGVCCNQRCFSNNPVTPKELRNSRDKVIAAVRVTSGDTVPSRVPGSCCAGQCTNLRD